MAAEHSKWSSHVAGAAQLIQDIDFRGITREVRAMRARVRARRNAAFQSGGWSDFDRSFLEGVSEEDPFADKESDIDEDLISALVGRAIQYDEIGQVEPDKRKPNLSFTAKDIENFRIQCDLYWLYCKQDLFRSIISGNHLLCVVPPERV
jgi:hypothetical protein